LPHPIHNQSLVAEREPLFLVSLWIIIDAVTILVGENLIISSENEKKAANVLDSMEYLGA